ncbi:MAG: hypothetical protein U5N53_28435 [Mycobacterium sp.]|nr:hypothetical protein [Mycobacterium sp.]
MTLQHDIQALVAWNDALGVPEVVRMLKLGEESGEAAVTEYFGYRGLNPRKGVTNGVESVLLELADTALAALVALESLQPGAALITLCQRAEFVRERLGFDARYEPADFGGAR